METQEPQIKAFWDSHYKAMSSDEHRISYEAAEHLYKQHVSAIVNYAGSVGITYDNAIKMLFNYKVLKQLLQMPLLPDIVDYEYDMIYKKETTK
jgi:hypothetical protein